MNCPEAREGLEEYRRGELPRDAAAALEAHLAGCAACARVRDAENALAAMLRDLPRTPASPALRRRVSQLTERRRPGFRWLARPWAAAAVAAATVALALSPWLQFQAPRPPDPLETFLQAGLTEHRRILLELQALAGEVADPASAFAAVRSLTDVPIAPVFAGDDELTLMAARPTMIVDRKAAAVVLRDRAWFITTYFAVPGKDLPPPPESGRVRIGDFRPFMRRADGFHLIYWKQGGLAYLMVSDLDDVPSQQLYLKMRKAL